MTNTPPDWVLIEAAKQSKLDNDTPRQRAILFDTNPSFRALCDMIAKHEQKPVDRKLLCAREAERSFDGRYRTAEMIAIRAIELWIEGYGE
jgi:hypothetical protein